MSTLSQIIIGLLFTNISFVEKRSAQAVLNLAESISADNTNLSFVLSYYL